VIYPIRIYGTQLNDDVVYAVIIIISDNSRKMCAKFCSYLLNVCHNVYDYMQISSSESGGSSCRFWFCFNNSETKDNDEDDEDQLLRFWVPQRSFSTQSGSF
jgi:hypothetical protein